MAACAVRPLAVNGKGSVAKMTLLNSLGHFERRRIRGGAEVWGAVRVSLLRGILAGRIGSVGPV